MGLSSSNDNLDISPYLSNQIIKPDILYLDHNASEVMIDTQSAEVEIFQTNPEGDNMSDDVQANVLSIEMQPFNTSALTENSDNIVVEAEVGVEEYKTAAVEITINRIRVQEDMIVAFKNEDILSSPIKVKFVNELGQDADGVSRDAYSAFWASFFTSNADGEESRVPILTPEYGAEEWQSVGRILVKGFKDLKYFPTLLSSAYAIAVIFGEECVTPEILKESFLKFLSDVESQTVEAALLNKSYDEDTLIDLLDRAQCHAVPSQSEMAPTIQQVAHKTIIQESKYALDAISSIAMPYLKGLIPSIDHLMSIYSDLKPTCAKVVALFRCNPATKEESQALTYLTRFVRGRNEMQLKTLIRFLTGADVICVSHIEIQFVVRHGAARAPTVHTCGPTLQLPSTYIHFPD